MFHSSTCFRICFSRYKTHASLSSVGTLDMYLSGYWAKVAGLRLASALFSALLALAACEQQSGHLYTSLTAVDDLFAFDQLLAAALSLAPEKSSGAERYLESQAWVAADRARGGGQEYAVTGNPLHIYALFKRLVLYWPEINQQFVSFNTKDSECNDNMLQCMNWAERGECEINPSWMRRNCRYSCDVCPSSEFLDGVRKVLAAKITTVLPTDNDLRGTAIALSRLRKVYKLHIRDLVQGRLLHTVSSVKLSVFDSLRVANACYATGDLASAWMWYRHSFRMASDLDLKAHISMLMEPVAQMHDDAFRSNHHNYFPAKISVSQDQLTWDYDYSKLCRGEIMMTAEEASQLHCHVSSRGSPYLTLQPIRYEQLHYDPEMYMFYDVLSDAEIRAIQDTAKSKLARSHVLSKERLSEIRVSQTAWLANFTHPALPRINQRISYVTGLHVFEGPFENRGGEQLQVLSYGVGGHYQYHLDHFFKIFPPDQWHTTKADEGTLISGERLATWMFYLSDVEAGGWTAFPKAKISVAPVKGAAVMWYNLKKNGDCNWQSEHGGCPVILGHKWAIGTESCNIGSNDMAQRKTSLKSLPKKKRTSTPGSTQRTDGDRSGVCTWTPTEGSKELLGQTVLFRALVPFSMYVPWSGRVLVLAAVIFPRQVFASAHGGSCWGQRCETLPPGLV
ncbi:prolyl 4-hydroxylase subunit alpha-3-like [Penaeus chinensis]|uniref:prolyl 4-hydroxylase subunit alpha-3-like n=1 Tax=Penaeus chinensis TaxID=139456 RepID=UPI001FB5D542|nr:prolyl 4-hydroxylase subunit alpha-3-like [Penaeus chinensis]